MRPMLVTALWSVLAGVAGAQDPLAAGEVLVLLEAGVPPDEVERTLARRGGPSSITEAELEGAVRLGCGGPLLRRLEGAAESLRSLRRLAEEFEVWRDPGRRVELLVPRGWTVASESAEGRLFLTMASARERDVPWFRVPTIFLALESKTALPAVAETEVAARIARLLQDRIEGLGLAPRDARAGAGAVGDRTVPHHEMTATAPGTGFPGVIAFRTRVVDDGSVATFGFTCAREAASGLRPVFETVVTSFFPDGAAGRKGAGTVQDGPGEGESGRGR